MAPIQVWLFTEARERSSSVRGRPARCSGDSSRLSRSHSQGEGGAAGVGADVLGMDEGEAESGGDAMGGANRCGAGNTDGGAPAEGEGGLLSAVTRIGSEEDVG